MDNKLSEHIESVKIFLKQQSNIGKATISDEEMEFLAELREWLDSGAIVVDPDSQRFFDMIGHRYPIAASRIAWPAIRPHHCLNIRAQFTTPSVHCDDLAKAMDAKRVVIQGWFIDNGISDNIGVAVVGDMYDLALRMNVRTLLNCYPILFVQPQHTYVMPLDCDWCLMGTIEGQIYFGKSSDVLATGEVDLKSFLR